MSYSASNTYATTEQLRKRLSTSGMTWAQDVDAADAYADSGEAGYGEEAVEYANVLCDEALAPHVSVVPRPANDWVKDRCIDIAAWRLVTLGGREPTPPIQLAYDEAREKLDMVREGTITVPGLNYNQTLLNGQQGVPPIQIANVQHSRRWTTRSVGCG